MEKIVTRTELLARGVTDAELQRLCRTGVYQRLRRGVYSTGDLASLTARERHEVRAHATMGAARAPDTTLSHVSAAVLLGLETWDLPLDAVHVSRNRSGGGGRNSVRIVHAQPFTEDEVTLVEGVRVTTPARTVADLARAASFEQAVVTADSAQRRCGVHSRAVIDLLDRCPTHPGHAGAQRVAHFMDGRSESVGESRSRVLFHHNALPVLPQFAVPNTQYRADFLIAESVIGEFDGRIKYGRLVRPGDSPGDVAWREKLREDSIRTLGYEVVRWTWADLDRPGRVIARVRAALNRRPGTLSVNRTPPPAAGNGCEPST